MKNRGHLDMVMEAIAVAHRRGERWDVRPAPMDRSPVDMTAEEKAEHDRFFPQDTEHVRWGLRFAGVAAVVVVVVVVGLVIVAVTL